MAALSSKSSYDDETTMMMMVMGQGAGLSPITTTAPFLLLSLAWRSGHNPLRQTRHKGRPRQNDG